MENTTKKPTVVSTFAGCGGSSLGYKLAGFQELLVIDFDENAHETFKRNFPGVMAWNADIKNVTAEQILEATKLKKGELDVFDGSPPCQGFSTAGKRQVNDSRNDLFKEFVRLVDGLQPKVFVMENVSGMIKGKMKGRFNEIIRELRSLNYIVKVKLMNAMHYEVPQSRERVIFIGVRKDLNIEPSFPLPSNKIITVGEATKGVVPKTFIPLQKEWLSFELWNKMKPNRSGSDVHPQGSFFSMVKLHPNLPCRTITKMINVGATFCNGLYHWEEPRTMAIEEIKRLASFPDDFVFLGSFENQWARIGNAVMPNMMKAIANHIKVNMLK